MKKKIIIFILSVIFSQFCIYYVNSRERINNSDQLKDPLIDNLPFFDGLDKFYDLTIFPPVSLIFLYLLKGNLPIDNLIINISAILFLRGICILTTSIPKFASCKESNFKNSLWFSGGCYDKIFSGHLAFIVTLSLYLINYTDQKKYKIIYYLYIIASSFLALVSESHYSIDLLISWILSTTLFFMINNNLNFIDVL